MSKFLGQLPINQLCIRFPPEWPLFLDVGRVHYTHFRYAVAWGLCGVISIGEQVKTGGCGPSPQCRLYVSEMVG